MRRFAKKSWKAVVLAIAIVSIPTAAFAVIGSFTSSTTTAAVTGKNTSTVAQAKGVYGYASAVKSTARYGVYGKALGTGGIGGSFQGALYGVVSNGPFLSVGNASLNGNVSIAPGKTLTCSGCVGVADLSSAAQGIQPLASGGTESGVFEVSDVYPAAEADELDAAITFVRPVPGTLSFEIGGGPDCTTVGTAAPGFVCVYLTGSGDVSFLGGGILDASPHNGASLSWTELGGGDAFANGSFTVKAP